MCRTQRNLPILLVSALAAALVMLHCETRRDFHGDQSSFNIVQQRAPLVQVSHRDSVFVQTKMFGGLHGAVKLEVMILSR